MPPTSALVLSHGHFSCMNRAYNPPEVRVLVPDDDRPRLPPLTNSQVARESPWYKRQDRVFPGYRASPPRLMLPQRAELVRRSVLAIEDYFSGAVESGLWHYDSSNRFEVISRNPGGDNVRQLYQYRRQQLIARISLRKGDYVSARQSFDESFVTLKCLFAGEHPQLLYSLSFDLCRAESSIGSAFHGVLLRHAVGVLAIMFRDASTHPLRRLISALHECPPNEQGGNCSSSLDALCAVCGTNVRNLCPNHVLDRGDP